MAFKGHLWIALKHQPAFDPYTLGSSIVSNSQVVPLKWQGLLNWRTLERQYLDFFKNAFLIYENMWAQ